MRSGIFILGLIVMFGGLMGVTPTFRLIPLVVALIGVLIAIVGAVLPRKVPVSQTVTQ